jgi:hypothetical protein
MRTLDDFRTVLVPIRDQLIQSSSLECQPELQEILAQNTRLIVALNHSTPLSWVPAMCLLATAAIECGHGDRVPMVIADRFFFSMPGLRALAKYISQSERPLNFDELVETFARREHCDLIVFPEGSNCFFGDPKQIREFRSPKFIEIAVRVGCPILLSVHRGSEDWAKAVSIPAGLVGALKFLPESVRRRLLQTGLLTLPLLPKPIAKFRMQCELFMPSINDSSVAAEADRLHARMQEMFEHLNSGPKAD